MKQTIKKYSLYMLLGCVFLSGVAFNTYYTMNLKNAHAEALQPSLIELEKQALEYDIQYRLELKERAKALRNEADLLEGEANHEVEPRIRCRKDNIIGDLSKKCETDFIDHIDPL